MRPVQCLFLVTLLIAGSLVALPFAGLLAPVFSYDPNVFPYGAYVSSSGRLLRFSLFITVLLALIFLLLPTRLFRAPISWSAASANASIYIFAAVGLMSLVGPLSRQLEARISPEVAALYEGIELGSEQQSIEQAIRQYGYFSLGPLQERDDLAGFPVDTSPEASKLAQAHGSDLSIALWFRQGSQGGLKLFRKALLNKRTILEIKPLVQSEEVQVLVGVLSPKTGDLEFTHCGSRIIDRVSLSNAPAAVKQVVSGDSSRNAVLRGRIVEQSPGSRAIEVLSYRVIGEYPSYDQSLYDTCRSSW